MTELVRKAELDGRVAELLGKKRRDVSMVTEAFMHEVVRALVESGEVRLDGVGTMRVVCRRGVRQDITLTHGHGHKKGRKSVSVVAVCAKYYVSFRRSTRLREALQVRFGKQEKVMGMDKYGVDEDADGEKLEKAAAEGCPKCGAKCTKHGNTLVCPTCGTEPWESEKKK